MSHSYTHLLYHMVWSTKDRVPLIADALAAPLYAYIGGIVRQLKGSLIECGGIEDHIHLFVRLPPTLSAAEAASMIKASSSKWARQQHPDFRWQAGYGAFSVSESAAPRLMRYIRNQREHHKVITFKEEFLLLLKKHRQQVDPEHFLD